MSYLKKYSRICVLLLLLQTLVILPDSRANEAQDLLTEAYMSYQQEQWKAALTPLKRTLKLYPDYAEAHHLLGLVLNNLGQSEQAIIHLQEAVKAYPTFVQAYVDLGFVFQEKKQYKKAEHAFYQALEIYPTFLEPRVALASLFDQQQTPQKAIHAHQEVLDLDPHNVDSLYGLAFWHIHEGNIHQAQTYVDQLTSEDPNHLNVWLLAGSIAQQSDQVDKAVQAYQHVITLKETLVDPYFNLGILYQKQEKYEEAAQAFESAIRLDAKNPEAHVNLGVVYAALSKLDQAEQEYRTALDLNPDLSEAHYNLGLLYEFHHNAPQKALQHYEEYVKLGGQDERITKLLKKARS